ncbi:hypothetical protein KKG41_00055 [Patescibacteria group bacterium]|nr:hypothetical protein [Patescibacteria group bacterium]MBU1890182.1 hypothetical protein [Patescibacteria group bacterium]
MSLKNFLVLMTIVTTICWIGWITVLFYINPDGAGFIGQVLFFVSLFFALIGTFSILGFFLRVWFSKKEMVFQHVGKAFRQAFLFSLLIVGSLILQGMRIFTWWNATLFIICVAMLELFFLTRKEIKR